MRADVPRLQQRQFFAVLGMCGTQSMPILSSLGRGVSFPFEGFQSMALSHLSTVADNGLEAANHGGRGGDAATWRMRQLQFEARALGREQIEALARDLSGIANRAA